MIRNLIFRALVPAAVAVSIGGFSCPSFAYTLTDSLTGTSLSPGLEIAPGYTGSISLGVNGAVFSTTGGNEAAIRSTFTFTGSWSLTIDLYGIDPGTQGGAVAGIQAYGGNGQAALFAVNDYAPNPLNTGWFELGSNWCTNACSTPSYSQITGIYESGLGPNSAAIELVGDTNIPLTFQVFLSGVNGPTNSVSFENLAFTAESISSTPLPAALPLFAGGLGMIGLLAGRKKRKAASAAAA